MQKVKATKIIRLHIDIERHNPAQAPEIRAFVNVVEDVVREMRSVRTAKITEIIPAEGERFDWQEQ